MSCLMYMSNPQHVLMLLYLKTIVCDWSVQAMVMLGSCSIICKLIETNQPNPNS